MDAHLSWTLALAALTVAALPAAIWLLRRPGRGALALGLALTLLTCTSASLAVRLWQDRPAPFKLQQTAGHFQVIAASDLDAALLAAQGKPVLLDFYADWCPGCRVWKQQIFNRPDVQQAMSPFVLLQVDASAMTPDVQASLNRYSLPGLPALLSFDRQGQELPALRLLGEMPAPRFMEWLRQHPASATKR